MAAERAYCLDLVFPGSVALARREIDFFLGEIRFLEKPQFEFPTRFIPTRITFCWVFRCVPDEKLTDFLCVFDSIQPPTKIFENN